MNIEYVDFLMGIGKSNKIVEFMRNNNKQPFLYVSPLLSEIQGDSRVTSIGFEAPRQNQYGNKLDNIKYLLSVGENISCTHTLFLMFDEDCMRMIKTKGYILIVDEELDVIKPYKKYSSADFRLLIQNKYIKVDEDRFGAIRWIADEKRSEIFLNESGKMHDFFVDTNNNKLYTSIYKEDGGEIHGFVVEQMDYNILRSFQRVIFVGYNIMGSIPQLCMSLRGFKFVKCKDIYIEEHDEYISSVKSRINLLPYDSNMDLSLTSTAWKGYGKKEINLVNNFIRRTIEKNKFNKEDVMYTFPVTFHTGDNKKSLKVRPKGFSLLTDSFVPCNSKAVNHLSHKKLAIHCFNRYPNVVSLAYLGSFGIRPDINQTSLSELLQWLFRSNIRVRNGGSVTVAVASKRMWLLLYKWLSN